MAVCKPDKSSAATPIAPTQIYGAKPANSLCQLGWRPQLITGLLRDLLIRHFNNVDNINGSMLRELGSPFTWQDSPSTGILIESLWRWQAEMTEKRPALLIKRNAYRDLQIALNDRALVDAEGFTHYNTLFVGSHTIFCLHGTGAGAELLANKVFEDLHDFAPEIRTRLGLAKFRVMEVGEVSDIEESTQNFVVPVIVGWTFQHAWKLQPMALPLKTFDVSDLMNMI